jgi:uncharacterized protein YdeI (YjbR/CyaY-like superfamily)
MPKHDTPTFYPTSPAKWRAWLQKNHAKEQSVWMIGYKQSAGKPTVSWSEAVDEALCFGWIDSTRKSIDAESFMQFFSRRKPNSTWSKINKDKVKVLIAEGKMTQAGLDSIALAKKNGSWDILNTVDMLEIPKDLEKEFKARKGSKEYFMSLSKSIRKMMLQWIVLAKRPETRAKRIEEIAVQAAKKQKPKQF